MDEEITIIEGSGNVFADLGLPNPEERLTKAELALQIGAIIEERNLTQKAAAAILGIPQPQVSHLLRGRLSGFSVERLMHFLTALDRNVEIVISAKPPRQPHGAITVRVQPPLTR
jgi:predicted XRE-type DNA-binding protein